MIALKSKTISAVSVLMIASAAANVPTAAPGAATFRATGNRFPSAAPSVAPFRASSTTGPTTAKSAGAFPSSAPSAARSNFSSTSPAVPSRPFSSSGTIVGNDKDEYGCILLAGYSWCVSLNKCVQPVETPCPKANPASQAPSSPSSTVPSSAPSVAPSSRTASTLPGSDRDAHGCIPSAGYKWCESLEECIQPFNTVCPRSAPATNAPSSESGNDKDANGCFASAGEVYCPEMEKCIQPAAESCPVAGITVTLDGPTTMECSGTGRCDISGICDIQPSGEDYTLGGLYLTDLSGIYRIPQGCSATCHGCVEYDDGSSASSVPHGVVAAAIVAAVAQLVLV